MEQKDKEILKSINGFVLYCKGFYKHTLAHRTEDKIQ